MERLVVENLRMDGKLKDEKTGNYSKENIITWEEGGVKKTAIGGITGPTGDYFEYYRGWAVDAAGRKYELSWRTLWDLDERFDHHIPLEDICSFYYPDAIFLVED